VFRFFLSWRYLISRRTNYIGVAGIFLGVFAPIVIQSIMTGFLEESKRVLRGNLSDVAVEPLFAEREDGRMVETEAGPLIRVIREDERTRAVAVRLSWYGIASEGGPLSRLIMTGGQTGQLSAVELVGVDVLTVDKLALATLSTVLLPGIPLAGPGIQDEIDLTDSDEPDATDFFESLLREPRWGSRVANPLFPFNSPPGYRPEGRRKASVIVGESLFYQLDLRRGSILHIGSSTPHPETGELRSNTREFVVAGSFRSRDRMSDTNRIYMQRTELADFLQDGREYSKLMVTLNDYEGESAAFCDDLVERGDAAALLFGDDLPEVRTWERQKQGMIGAVQNERIMMGIMLGLVIIVAGFTIFAILSMMVFEKRRDIGILTAIGATPRGVFSTFFMIGLWDALIGATSGAVLGTWAALEVGSIDSWISEQFGYELFSHEIFAFDQVPSKVQPVFVACMLAFGIVCTLLFASIPAWRASRLDPLDALRTE